MTSPFDEDHHPRKPGLFASLRASFLTGIVVIAPIGMTIWLVWGLMGWVDSVVLPLVPATIQPEKYIGINLRGVGVIIFLIFTVIIGWIAKGLIGRSLINFGERLVDRMPVVRSIYSGVKQIAETVFAQSDRNFETACLIEYPRRGIWAIGFISTDAKGEIAAAHPDDRLMGVFVPTTPNPTSGFLLFFPKKDIIELKMSVEEAAKLVISAGLVYPNAKDPSKPPAAGKTQPPQVAPARPEG
ncbi:DUF502 domain-containing protein [Shimia sp.]|uniref:DUF502 domain-containing protein n=1 Tax=Shimia sp. TaxID=1954381 RepID=UPI003563BFA2